MSGMNEGIAIVLRVSLTFAILLMLIRLQGKKQIAQFTYFNYINGIAIGSLAANVVFVRDEPFGSGLMMLVVWSAITWLVSYLSMKSAQLRIWFEGVPRYMMKEGHFIEENLRKEYITLEDLTSMLRQKNNFAAADVELAILELNGSLSVQSKSGLQPVVRGDLQLEDKPSGIALPLIVDGVIHHENLKANHLKEDWLLAKAKALGAQPEEVLYMELGVDGKIKLEKKE